MKLSEGELFLRSHRESVKVSGTACTGISEVQKQSAIIDAS